MVELPDGGFTPKETKQHLVALDEETNEYIESRAREEMRSKSNLVRFIIQEEIKRHSSNSNLS